MLCLIHRKRIHHALDRGTPLPESTHAHCQRCASCRDWLGEQQRIHQLLHETAAATPRETTPEWLLTRIRANLTDQPPAAGRLFRTRRSRLIGGAAAAAALALVTLAVLLDLPFRKPSRPMEPPTLRDTAQRQKPETALQALRNLGPNPLETEIDLLTEDTRSVLEFLAANFVPGDPDHLDRGRS